MLIADELINKWCGFVAAMPIILRKQLPLERFE